MELNVKQMCDFEMSNETENSDSNRHRADVIPHALMSKGEDSQITDKTDGLESRPVHSLLTQEESGPKENCHAIDKTSTNEESFRKGRLNLDSKLDSVSVLDDQLNRLTTHISHECLREPDMTFKKKSPRDPKYAMGEPGLGQEEVNISDILGNFPPSSLQNLKCERNKSAKPVPKRAFDANKGSKSKKKATLNVNTKPKKNDNRTLSKTNDYTSTKRLQRGLVKFQKHEVQIPCLSKVKVPLAPRKDSEPGGREAPRDPNMPLTSFSEFKAALLGDFISDPVCEPTNCSPHSEKGVCGPMQLLPVSSSESHKTEVSIAPSITMAFSATLAEGVKHKNATSQKNPSFLSSVSSAVCLYDPQVQNSEPTTHTSSSSKGKSNTNGRPPSGLGASSNFHEADPPQPTVRTPRGVSLVQTPPPLPRHSARGKHGSLDLTRGDYGASCGGGNDGAPHFSILPYLRFTQTWGISSGLRLDNPSAVGLAEAPHLPSLRDVQGAGGDDAGSSGSVHDLNAENHAGSNGTGLGPSSRGVGRCVGASAAPTPTPLTLLTDRIDTLLPAWSLLTSLIVPARGVEQGPPEYLLPSHSRSASMREGDREGPPGRGALSPSKCATHLPLKRHFFLYPLAFSELTPFGAGGDRVDETRGSLLTCGEGTTIDAGLQCSFQFPRDDQRGSEKFLYYQVRVRICLNVGNHVSSHGSTVYSTPVEAKPGLMPTSTATNHPASSDTTKNHVPLLCSIDVEPRFSRCAENQESLQRFAQDGNLSEFYLRAHLKDAALQLIARAPLVSESIITTSQKGAINFSVEGDPASCETNFGAAENVQSNIRQPNLSPTPRERDADAGVNLSFLSCPTPDLGEAEGESLIEPIGLSVESEVPPSEAASTSSTALTLTLTLTARIRASLTAEGRSEGTTLAENDGEGREMCISRSRLVYLTLVSIFLETFILSPHTSRVEFAMYRFGKPSLPAPNGGVLLNNDDVSHPSCLGIGEWGDIALEELRRHCVLRINRIYLKAPPSRLESADLSTAEVVCRLDENGGGDNVEETHQIEASESHDEVDLGKEGIAAEETQVDADKVLSADETPKPEVIPDEGECSLCQDLPNSDPEPGEDRFPCEPQKSEEVYSISRGGAMNSIQDTTSETFTQEKDIEDGSRVEHIECDVRDMTAELLEKTKEVYHEAEQVDFLIKNYRKIYDVPPSMAAKINSIFNVLRAPRPGHARRVDPAAASNTKHGKRSPADHETTKTEGEFLSTSVQFLIAEHVALFSAKGTEGGERGTHEDTDRGEDPHAFFTKQFGSSLSSLISVLHTIMWRCVAESAIAVTEGFDKDETSLLEPLFAALSSSLSSEIAFTAIWALNREESLLRGFRKGLFNLTDHSISQSHSFAGDPTLTSFSEATSNECLAGGFAGPPPSRATVVGHQVLGAKLRKSGRKHKPHPGRAGMASASDPRGQKAEEQLVLPALCFVVSAAAEVSGVSPSANPQPSLQVLGMESGASKAEDLPLAGDCRLIFKSPRALSAAKIKLQAVMESLERCLVVLRGVSTGLRWGTTIFLERSALPLLSEHMLIFWDEWRGLCNLDARSISPNPTLNESIVHAMNIIDPNMSSIAGMEGPTKSIPDSEFSSNGPQNEADKPLSSSHNVEHFEIECVQSEEKLLRKSLPLESRGVSRESSGLATSSLRAPARPKKRGIAAHKQNSSLCFENNAKVQNNSSIGEGGRMCPPVQQRNSFSDETSVLKVPDSLEKGPATTVNAKNINSKTTLRRQGSRKVSPSSQEADATTRLVLIFIIVGALLFLVLLYI